MHQFTERFKNNKQLLIKSASSPPCFFSFHLPPPIFPPFLTSSLSLLSPLPLFSPCLCFQKPDKQYMYVPPPHPPTTFQSSPNVRPLCPFKYYLSFSFSLPRCVHAFKTFVKGGLIDKTIARRGLNTAFKGVLLNCRQEGEGQPTRETWWPRHRFLHHRSVRRT